MAISYRTRRRIRRIATTSLTMLAVALVLAVVLVLWLQRFVVYTDQGAKLDFRPKPAAQAQIPQAPTHTGTVDIQFDDRPFREGLQQLSGYYLDPQDLMKDPEAVKAHLETLPPNTAVLLDVKGYRGYFYYSTGVGLTTSGSYDMDKMDSLISWLTDSDLYVIARFSALRDFDFAYHDTSLGLPLKSGALYSDQGRYGLGYWLDPAREKVQNYLIQIIKELRNLGFDEVVLQNYCFPNTDSVVYQGDKAAILEETARKIISACGTESFTVSFSSSDPGFSLPEGRCRLYLEDVEAAAAQAAWDAAQVEDKRLNLVFLAPGADTRYDIENGVLRLLDILK